MRKDNKRKNFLIIILSIVIAVGLAGFGNISFNSTSRSSLPSDNRDDLIEKVNEQNQAVRERPRVPCVNYFLPIPEEYHIHSRLKIIINGEEKTIP
ncbi:MAG: hypothetical protein ACK4NX_03925, partial [Candidatus Paceibacteria bacterium]